MNELTNTDLHFCVTRIPRDVRELMKKHSLFLAGGFIRATIAGEKPTDVDLFGRDESIIKLAAQELALARRGRLHETPNAFTILAPPRMPVQIIRRWLYQDIEKLIEAFDFTIAQAAIFLRKIKREDSEEFRDEWVSCISERFYSDLAARRLYYTYPQRDEEVGGSFLRMRKFLKKGYTIQAHSMAGVVARLVSKLDFSQPEMDNEKHVAFVICGLLREVDPAIVVDGIDVLDEHEVIENERENEKKEGKTA